MKLEGLDYGNFDIEGDYAKGCRGGDYVQFTLGPGLFLDTWLGTHTSTMMVFIWSAAPCPASEVQGAAD